MKPAPELEALRKSIDELDGRILQLVAERVKVVLRNPDREVDIAGDRLVREVLTDLAIDPDTVLVIRAGELLTRHDRVGDADKVEVRPVISGGTG